MFEVGDKVRYVPNEKRDSYQGVIGRRGAIAHVYGRYPLYPYRVEFDSWEGEYFCNDSELEHLLDPAPWVSKQSGSRRTIGGPLALFRPRAGYVQDESAYPSEMLNAVLNGLAVR